MTWCTAPVIAPSHDSVLLRALGRAHYWQHLLDTDAVVDTAEIAKREGIIRSTVNDVLRLALERLLWAMLPREWGAA